MNIFYYITVSLFSIFAVIVSFIGIIVQSRSAKEAQRITEQSHQETYELQKRNNELQEANNELQREYNLIQASERFLNWNDVEKYVRAIVKMIQDETFIPNCIVACFERDAIVATMINQALNYDIPIYICMLKYAKGDDIPQLDGFTAIYLSQHNDMEKVYVLIQEKLPEEEKILLVRDHTGSGICFGELTKHLKSNCKIKEENIKTACIAYSDATRNTPDYCCFKSNSIYFPWGKNI